MVDGKGVSVPYRGATFLNYHTAKYGAPGQEFPSPIGELHFSILLDIHQDQKSYVSVPYRGATFLN